VRKHLTRRQSGRVEQHELAVAEHEAGLRERYSPGHLQEGVDIRNSEQVVLYERQNRDARLPVRAVLAKPQQRLIHAVTRNTEIEDPDPRPEIDLQVTRKGVLERYFLGEREGVAEERDQSVGAAGIYRACLSAP